MLTLETLKGSLKIVQAEYRHYLDTGDSYMADKWYAERSRIIDAINNHPDNPRRLPSN